MPLQRLAATAIAAAVPFAATAGTYSDLWFNPQQPGWGVQVTEQDEIAFVTFYTYGADGRPTWFVASDARVIAYSGSGALPVFQGTLYRTEGTYHGQSWDPAKSRVVPVGTISLELLDRDRMRIFYDADGVSGVKEVRRLAVAQPIELANYEATMSLRQVVGNQPIGTLFVQAEVLLHLDSGTGQAYLRADDQLGRRCEYRGPYEVTGKLVRASGTYACSSGDQRQGTFQLTDLEVTAHGFTGYLRTTSGNDSQYGRLGGIRW